MASLSLQSTFSFLFNIAALALLFSPAHSQNCTSQTFSHSNTTFANCLDLPSLNANLHWTYDPAARPNPTLSIAFIAPPARPEGWVAWALNPNGTGMVGAQALIAFRDTNGSMVVRTYNLASYSSIIESRISYDVLSRRAEYSGGVMRIFATLALPSPGAVVNQVWQVGPSVTNGVPARHDLSPANLAARSTLELAGRSSNGPAAAPMAPKGNGPAAASPGGSGAPGGGQSGNDNGGSSRVWSGRLGLYGVLVLLGVWIF